MSAYPEFDPVIVHASARGGSTYFFNVLRRDESLMCFNEAIDDKRDLMWFREFRRRQIARSGKPRDWDVNHEFLDRDDNQEFFDAWDSVKESLPTTNLEMQDYFTLHGKLPEEILKYLASLMTFARSRGQRPALCEVSSRGRAGALRDAFGGFHITQYRNPISQFGSYVRALVEGRTWDFLIGPVVELNTSIDHPLIRIIPEKWKPRFFPWRTGSRGQFWGSRMRYHAAFASSRPETVVELFRCHMFTWTLGFLAAVSYSDLVVDIEKLYDDAEYRAFISSSLVQGIGGSPLDFADIRKFDRYHEFNSLNVTEVCNQVMSVIQEARADGRLETALRALAQQPPMVSTASAVKLLLEKIGDSISDFDKSKHRTKVSDEKWKDLADKNRRIWFNPVLRRFGIIIHPLVFSTIRAARLRGLKI